MEQMKEEKKTEHIALYRKYRPQTFKEIMGQDKIVKTLVNQIQGNKISHAYLFSGPRGTGKTSIAKIFAKTINCLHQDKGNPCLECESCKSIDNGYNVDIVEIDGASNNGIDNIRDLIEQTKYKPQFGKYKVYIIDEAHMLSTSAFNALLKTLEEPASNLIFILTTTEEYKIPPTIYSRCQSFKFQLINIDTIIENLKDKLTQEGYTIEDSALKHIGEMANGSMRDALTILEQCMDYVTNKSIKLIDVKALFGDIARNTTAEMIECIEQKDINSLLTIAYNQIEQGKTLYNICCNLYDYYKDKYLHDKYCDYIETQRKLNVLANLSESMKKQNNRNLLDIGLMNLCYPQTDNSYLALYKRVLELEDIVSKLGIKTMQKSDTELTIKTIRDNNSIITKEYLSA